MITVDREAILNLPEPARIALALAYRESNDLRNRPSLRDEWHRATWRHMFAYIITTGEPLDQC